MVSKIPILVAICEIVKKPVVVDDKIVIREMCNINLTLDHRYMDGGRSKKLNQRVSYNNLTFNIEFILKILYNKSIKIMLYKLKYLIIYNIDKRNFC